MKKAIKAIREALARKREEREAAKEAEKARKLRMEQMYESASEWLAPRIGFRIKRISTRSTAARLEFNKTEYGGERYVPKTRPGFGITPDRVEYVKEYESVTHHEYVFLGYNNSCIVDIENVGELNSGASIWLRCEVLDSKPPPFSGTAALVRPDGDGKRYRLIIPLKGQRRNLCGPIRQAYDLLDNSWELSETWTFDTSVESLIHELKSTPWGERPVRSLAQKYWFDKHELKNKVYMVVRLFAREAVEHSWHLLLQQRVTAVRWLRGPVWDVDGEEDRWRVQPVELPNVEVAPNGQGVDCEDEKNLFQPVGALNRLGVFQEDLGGALQKVAELYQAGLLTEEEFHRAKERQLGPDTE